MHRTAGRVWWPESDKKNRSRGESEVTMPESKPVVYRTSSYLSHSTYRKIKRVLSFRRRVFGQRLEETVLYERRYGVHMAPLVVEQCVDFIRERGLTEVGLFRQPGQATLVKELQEAFDAGEKPSFDSSTDVHTVASLLKLYLRELPEPLVPFSRYPDFLICGKRIPADRKQGLLELRSLLHELPVANFNLLNYICQFLNEVQTYSSSNKMNIENLATVFGPNILRPKAEDPESIIGGTAAIQHLMSDLIREHSLLFSKDGDTDTPRISRPAPLTGHRHSNHAEWAHTELDVQECDSHLGMAADCLPSPHLASTPCSRQLSLPLTAERRGSSHSPRERRKSPLVTETASQLSAAAAIGSSPAEPQSYSPAPSKCHSPDSGLIPLPASPSSPASSQTAVLEGPSQPADWSGIEEPRWTAEKDLGGNSGSSDAQDSTLSVYDNMDTMTDLVVDEAADTGSGVGMAEVEGATSVAGSGSTWSSCEALLQDGTRSGSGGPSSPCQASVSFPSLFRVDREDGDAHHNSLASSSAPTDAPLSTGSSEVFLPSAPPDPHMPTATHAMHCLLAGLRQQMARQKAEYEARIQRLERKNETLQAEVAGLRSSLEQQRQWFSVAEIKMRNVERARLDADRRNTALQKEMEQFFDTFGDLNAEAKKTERIIQSF
ncbi:rho GTPase-activating protein 24 isoform X3 [Clupea harengus]|uniref:Rho GTPase-activating protein 24 isoform X3 n=1 Tax=Clupea harengus TaxID=7950 RepID=A0A6P3W6L0_CLUHA|nr:rho GTPase-activating protein 24 isoform X3 [Clupea harengus]